jgi:hypothetical protein
MATRLERRLPLVEWVRVEVGDMHEATSELCVSARKTRLGERAGLTSLWLCGRGLERDLAVGSHACEEGESDGSRGRGRRRAHDAVWW